MKVKGTKLPTIDSSLLAEYILAKVGNMNHLKLQKLLYYLEAWHLAFFEQSLIEDEFEAWPHGPVSRKIWNEIKDKSILYGLIGITPNSKPKVILQAENILFDDQIQLIKSILKEYGKQDSYHLECLTHEELPWIEARKGLPPNVCLQNLLDTYRLKLRDSFYIFKFVI